MIGLDFDNTIVCYDGVFQSAAAEFGALPEEPVATKEELRDALRREGREDAWTELQGFVYGPGMSRAAPFPGALEFIAECVREDRPVAIISHRTRRPYLGPQHDLHAFAREWLREQGVTDPERIGLDAGRVHFEETKAGKLRRIAEVGCSVFVDDLPEFLTDADFPSGVERVVFDPHASEAALASGLPRLETWADARLVLDGTVR